jgi:pSer/pThr/pTyr-binding forkhead associated (FHA) protein
VAELAVYRGDQFVRRIELGKARTRVGRSPENELVLEDRDKGVSRAHAEIVYEGGRYLVVDLNSQNGVWIGDRRLKKDPLPVNVPVNIGPYRLILIPDAAATSPVKAPAGPVALEDEQRPEPTQVVEPSARMAATQVRSAPAPPQRKRSFVAAIAVVGILSVLGAGLLVMAMIRKPPVEDKAAGPPPGPTAEERFRDHYDKAQAYLEKGDKASATTENELALAALPSDPRGIKQQADIAALGAVTLPPDPPPVDPVAPAEAAAEATPTTVPPVPATFLKVAAKEGETAPQRNDREKLARFHLDDGKKALADGRYGVAINLLTKAMEASGRPDYGHTKGEAANLLGEARAAQAEAEVSQRRSNAQKLVADAKVLANAADTAGAVRKLREARALDPQGEDVSDLLKRLYERAREDGENALTSARNLDRARRTDAAIKDYEKAVQLLELLPDGHKDLADSRQRITALKTPR